MVTWEHGKCYQLIRSSKEIDNFPLKNSKTKQKINESKI